MISRDILLSDHLNGDICDRVISNHSSAPGLAAVSSGWRETMPGNLGGAECSHLGTLQPF